MNYGIDFTKEFARIANKNGMTETENKLALKIDRLLGQPSTLSRAADLITWASRFNKLPRDLIYAFADKATALFARDYYGDEEFNDIIESYLKGDK